MSRFESALDRNLDDIKRPPPPPIGSYVATVDKVPDMPREIEGKPYEILDINAKLVSPMEDVDPDELAEFGNAAGYGVRVTFVFNTEDDTKFESTLNRLKIFLGHCGIDEGAAGTLKEALAMLPGTQFVAQISHRLDERNNEDVYAEVERTAAID